MRPIDRLWNLAGGLRLLSRLDSDARRALLGVAGRVARENTRPRHSPGIHPTAMISPFVSLRFADRVEIGPKAKLQPYSCVWGGWSQTWARVGPGAIIGTGAVVVAGNHALRSPGQVRETGFDEADVTVAAGAGVSANAVVIGCRVGENALIGANAVVTRDVPDGAIAVGAPARVIGYRQPEYEPS